MASFGEAIINFPISGSSDLDNVPSPVFVRVVTQVSIARNYTIAHPGGVMTGSLLIASRNNNRQRFQIMNSGTLSLMIDHGNYFNPNIPQSPSNHGNNIILGSVILQGNQPAVPAIIYNENFPVYTGPIHGAWIGSGSLSGSVAIFTEFEG